MSEDKYLKLMERMKNALIPFAEPPAALDGRLCHKGITTMEECRTCREKLEAYRVLEDYHKLTEVN